MRRGQRLGDLGAGAEAGVNQSVGLQPVERLLVVFGALRLDDRFAVDGQSQPVEVLEDAVPILRPAPPRVQVLDAEQELTAAGPRVGMAQDCRIGVAQVQPPGGRGCETCDLQDSLHAKGDIGDS